MTQTAEKPSPLGSLSKFYGAIVGAILAQLLLRWLGIDVHALGVAYEFNALVIGLLDGAIMLVGGLVAGAVTYWFPPNEQKAKPPDRDAADEA